MNMLVNYIRKALAASTTIHQPLQMQARTQIVTRRYTDAKGVLHYEPTGEVRLVENFRRVKSRGKGGKTAHRFTGVRAVKRAAAKRRNRKG